MHWDLLVCKFIALLIDPQEAGSMQIKVIALLSGSPGEDSSSLKAVSSDTTQATEFIPRQYKSTSHPFTSYPIFFIAFLHDLRVKYQPPTHTIMFTRLKNAIAPPGPPSVVLALVGGFSSMTNALHIVPEDGTIERFGFTNHSSTFRLHGTTEQTRELIGEVTLYAGDGESTTNFLDDVEARVHKLWGDSQILSEPESADVIHRLEKVVLRPAGLDAIRAREGREPSMNATQTYPVFIIRINRSRSSKAGRILNDKPTSFG
ncbi:hypothetical protein FQN50_008299 [Emmonsiellopsis sp. PD_5]|nr:hypothetical protein FQN50_008299 [Emmonsiellopsis sp. PD_5]